MARHSDPMNRKTQPLADKEVHRREADRNARSPVDHTVEVTVLQLIIILGVALEALLRKEVPVQRLDRFLPRGSRTNPILHFLRHFIELSRIRTDGQGGIGIPGNQKSALFEVYRAIRQRRQLREFIFETSTADFFQYRNKTVSHFRLFDFRFLKKRNRGGTEVDEFPADGLDNLLVLIRQQPDQSPDLTFVCQHGGTLRKPAHQPIARRNTLALP